MKVPNINGIVSIARGQLEPRGAQQIDKTGQPASSDKVELSTEGQAVQRLAAERSDSGQRAELVAQLKADYEAGRLSSDTQATAEAMVAEGLFDDIIRGA